MKFCIENLPNDATEREIQQLFSGYGKVQSVQLMPGPLDGDHPGTGLIELEEIDGKDVGALPDRWLFRETVIRIRQQQCGTDDGQLPGDSVAASDPGAAAFHRPDNRTSNTLRVISVEKVVDPNTGESNGWCRYSITSLAGSITGLRHGSVAEVTLHAEEAAEAFNLRNMLGHRRPPTWSSRHRK